MQDALLSLLTQLLLPCSDGIALRAMNLPAQQDGIRDASQAAAYVDQLRWAPRV